MPEPPFDPMIALAIAALALLLALLVVAVGLGRRLKRIEQAMISNEFQADEERRQSTAEVSSGSVFEEFLNEEPERKKLPKNEQFAAYREWRRERGLNWAKP